MISVHNLSREYRDVKKNCTFPQVILGLDVYSIADLLVACVPVSICRTSFQLGMITAGALTFVVSSRFASHMQRRIPHLNFFLLSSHAHASQLVSCHTNLPHTMIHVYMPRCLQWVRVHSDVSTFYCLNIGILHQCVCPSL